jgi:CPA1 family monovalent cation:H+ antiporter
MALLTRQPRTADVVALGYCHLMTLQARDFRRLPRGNPEIKAQIEAIASERLAQNVAQGGG